MKGLIRAALAISATAGACVLSTQAIGAVGRTGGNFAVSDSGAATYSIPIWVPPGPRGVQPSLAIVYNSQSGGSGALGPGWSIAGLSAITRCPKTVAQDGVPAGITLATSDGFCLDGKRLRLTGGSYGQAGSTYQTEIADFSNVTANGTAGNGPASFTVRGKNGLTYEYGNGSNSQVLATGTSTASMWMLNKVTDRANNRMTISYVAPNGNLTGSTVPDVISWTPSSAGSSSFNYTLKFNYVGNNPQGSIIGYIAGTSVVNANLLANIQIENSGSTVRKYVFTYQASPTTGDNRLTQVQECADSAASNCLSSTTIAYQNGQVGTATSATSVVSATLSGFTSHRDFNGDGFTDLAWYQGSTWFISLGSSSGFGTAINTGVTSVFAVFGDVLGTGSDGILTTNGSTWLYYTYNGTSPFNGANTGIAVDTNGVGAALADIDGDGLPDLVTTTFVQSGANGGTHVFRRLNTTRTSGYFSTTPVSAFDLPDTSGNAFAPILVNADSQGSSLRAFDFNGDGREDVALIQQTCAGWIPAPGGGIACAAALQNVYELISQVSQSGGAFTGVAGTTVPASSAPIPYFLNWNNDACTDVVFFQSILISGCNGTVPLQLTTTYSPIAALDWDGDGRTDLLEANGGSTMVQLSTGSGLGTATATPIPNSTCRWMTFDANGDGLDEFGCISLNAQAVMTGFSYYAHNGAGLPPDLATSITDGYGITVSPTYVSLTQGVASSVYQKSTDATYPYKNYIGPSYVVSSYTATDGTGITDGAHNYNVQFRYAGAWMNLQGRGYAGFDSKREIDSRIGLHAYRLFRRDFPYTGMVREEHLYQSNGSTDAGQTVHTITHQTLDSTANNQRYFPFASSTTQNEWEVGGPKNGQLVTTAVTSFTFDSYGNATNTVTTVTDKDSLSPYFNLSWSTTVGHNVTPDTVNWCLGIPTSTSVTRTAPGVTSIGRSVSTVPDYSNCRVSQRTVAPSTAYAVTEAFSYDSFGNVNSISVTGNGMSARNSGINWGTTGQFPMSQTNPLGHVTQYGYDFARGFRTSLTDPNVVTASWQYDPFGRRTREDRPDGTATTWSYADCSGSCVNTAQKMTVTETVLNVGGSTQTDRFIYLNRYDRPLVTRERLLDGNYDRNEIQYDSRGRISAQTAPCSWTSCATFWTTTSYDVLSRPTQAQRPISATNSTLQTSTMQYAGRFVTTTDPQLKQSTKLISVAGTMLRSQDHNGYYQDFTYDPFGSLLSVTDSLSSSLFSATYDYGIDAFQRTSTDTDLGARSNNYNALGELTSYSDAKGQSFSVTYDALSRPLVRTEPDLTTTFTYGNSSAAHNIGALQSVTAGSYAESFAYDGIGRPASRTITIPSDGTYTFDAAYSATTGLLDTLTYPTSTSSYRLKLQYTYQNGILQRISDFNAPSTHFWTANATNARGQITQETLGNGVVTNRAFDAVTGWLGSQQSGVGGGAALQNESYLYDLVGNVTQRQNNNVGLTENFYYDNVYRLDHSTLGATTNLSLTYDATGNITSRSDVAGGATWTHGTSRKHAVTQAGSAAYTYTYDANGNVTSRNGYTVSWTSYDHPNVINGAGGESVDFSYTHEHERWRATYTGSQGTETTYFIGGSLEKVITVGNSDYRHFINAGATRVAIYSRTVAGVNTLRYVREDHQGSVAGIINSNGTSYVKESFTAFGARRSSCTWSGELTQGQKDKIASVTRRGYTWHTALGDMGLNDMNGRVQDAVTGRFLSPDPFVPDPGNTQSFNRYSYVLNNPLSFVDPSGFEQSTLWAGGGPDDVPPPPPIPCDFSPSCPPPNFPGLNPLIGGLPGFDSGCPFGHPALCAEYMNVLKGIQDWINNYYRQQQPRPDQTAEPPRPVPTPVVAVPRGMPGAAQGGPSYVPAPTMTWANVAGFTLVKPVGDLLARFGEKDFDGYSVNPLTGDGVSPRTMDIAVPQLVLGGLPSMGAVTGFLKAGAGKVTYLYQKVSALGEHLKFGITSSPATRYTPAQMAGGTLRIIATGSRTEMLRLERNLHETLPIGPEEGQAFYIMKQMEKGLIAPPYP